MKIAILGYDVEGRASFDYFKSLGHELTIRDKNVNLNVPDGVTNILGDNYLEHLDQYDLLVRTPGLHPRYILDKNPDVAEKITTHVNEFMKACPTKNIIGVTGTKGKGTTSTLITKLLESIGKQVKLGGNLGLPPLTFINDLIPESWVVLELSNFQLIDLKSSPHIAVCLGIVPEHLDWHKDIDEYILAKSQLFAHQTTEDIAIYYSENEVSKQVAGSGQAKLLPFYTSPGAYIENEMITIEGINICKTAELKLPGKHNWQNVCAAITAVWQVSKDEQSYKTVLTSFTSLEHRIEFVKDVNGIRYYNDSYASGLKATEAAIEAVPGMKVMILGGYDRYLDINEFGPYAIAHEKEFRKLLLIGQSAGRLADAFTKAGFDNFIKNEDLQTMDEIVAYATKLAQSGDAIVLSPGFASFDMFKNFSERGQKFKQAVNTL